jgi:predicted O-methyltransferase YrrM
MTTLVTSPVAGLLARLLSEADATEATLEQEMAKLAPGERAALFTNANDYRSFYSRAKNFHLAVSRETGTLLYMLARSSGARSIVEFGTSFGISTLYLAAALRDNGGGRLITTEFEPSKVAQARENVRAAGLSDLVEFREGDALETLARGLPDAIDLVLLDGAKVLYLQILGLVEAQLRAGAIIVADNADKSPEYLARVRSSAEGYLSVPFAADVEVSLKCLAFEEA